MCIRIDGVLLVILVIKIFIVLIGCIQKSFCRIFFFRRFFQGYCLNLRWFEVFYALVFVNSCFRLEVWVFWFFVSLQLGILVKYQFGVQFVCLGIFFVYLMVWIVCCYLSTGYCSVSMQLIVQYFFLSYVEERFYVYLRF